MSLPTSLYPLPSSPCCTSQNEMTQKDGNDISKTDQITNVRDGDVNKDDDDGDDDNQDPSPSQDLLDNDDDDDDGNASGSQDIMAILKKKCLDEKGFPNNNDNGTDALTRTTTTTAGKTRNRDENGDSPPASPSYSPDESFSENITNLIKQGVLSQTQTQTQDIDDKNDISIKQDPEEEPTVSQDIKNLITEGCLSPPPSRGDVCVKKEYDNDDDNCIQEIDIDDDDNANLTSPARTTTTAAATTPTRIQLLSQVAAEEDDHQPNTPVSSSFRGLTDVAAAAMATTTTATSVVSTPPFKKRALLSDAPYATPSLGPPSLRKMTTPTFSPGSTEEDAALHRLDRCGDLTQVVGSQSLLSQELEDCQRENGISGGFGGGGGSVLTADYMKKSLCSPLKKREVCLSMRKAKREREGGTVLNIINAAEKLDKEENTLLLHTPPPRKRPYKSLAGTPPSKLTPTTTTTPITTPSSSSRSPLPTDVLTQAKRAASFTKSILSNGTLYKRILLSMALTRTNPRTPQTDPGVGTTIPANFFWGCYPSLENVLRSHMAEYYKLSTLHKQTRMQQDFNNKLVTLVKAKAKEMGWKFAPLMEDDKKIRDRIRCFFKTHIQNSKKRLKTMLKNPEKRANAKALCGHYDLILKEYKNIDDDDDGDGEEEAEEKEMLKEKQSCHVKPKDESTKTKKLKIKLEDSSRPPLSAVADSKKRHYQNDNKKPPSTSTTKKRHKSLPQCTAAGTTPPSAGSNSSIAKKEKNKKDKKSKNNGADMSSVEVLDEYDAAQQVIALGFARLSQDAITT